MWSIYKVNIMTAPLVISVLLLSCIGVCVCMGVWGGGGGYCPISKVNIMNVPL